MPSYLLKNRNGNYYTRIPFPQSLRLLGCPQEIRVSLLTKDRSEATLRNLVAAHGIKLLMSKLATYPASILNPDNHPSKTCFRDLIAPELTRLRQQLLSSDDALTMPAQDPAKRPDDVSPPAPGCHDTMCKSITTELVQPQLAPHQLLNNVVTVPRTMRQLQTEFLRRKTGENISLRSLQQLQTRTTALILAVGGDFFVQALRFKQVDLFVQSLSTDKRLKAKTICEYKVACAQMLNFAVKLEYIAKNPFDQIKVKNSRSTPRQRWERSQLKTLFSSENFTQHAYDNADDFWIPLVLLHTGARPAEVCQLQTCDVVSQEHIACLNITNKGLAQSVKTDCAKRLVPIHSKLLALGFLHFVELRRQQGHVQLFSCKATGEFGEWTKSFEGRFSRYLNDLGFVAGQRPTAYGFRHAIIDELQQRATPEHVVADLVGHSKKGFTYRHYGKMTPLLRLQEVVEQLNFNDELTLVRGYLPCESARE